MRALRSYKYDLRGRASLVAVAFWVAAIWRLEVELKGWEGLIWISSVHLAIPIRAGLSTAWLAVFSNLSPWIKRLRLAGVLGDALHTIKSSNLFFFMTIGLGLPFLASKLQADLPLVEDCNLSVSAGDDP